MLSWLADIQNTQPIAYGIIILSLVAASGLSLGSIRVRGFGLGIAGTLFAGLIFAHFGYNMGPSFRSFIQEFGLILFVYTIGLQVGPGFLDSLRRQGLALNLLAGGPLLMAIILSRIGCVGPLLWYMPANASLLLRELGIVSFLSCVGLKSGTHLVETLIRDQGGGVWATCLGSLYHPD